LENISDRVGNQSEKGKSMLELLHRIANAQQIQEEIKSYFNDIQNACNTFQVNIFFFALQLLFLIYLID